MALNATSKIVTTERALAPLVKVLAGEIQMLTGIKPGVAQAAGQAGAIVVALDPALNNEAAYTLTVTDRVTVTGGGDIGAAHGTSLLLQAITRNKTGIAIPKITVKDQPYSQYYGCMVDLGKVTRLDRAQVFPYWDGGSSDQYKVEVSLDNKEWQQVVDMSANTKPATATGDMHKFPPTDARYVRITMFKKTANPAVHLVEFRVFGAGK